MRISDIPAYAAGSSISLNISNSPCKGNLSSYELPPNASELIQGNSYYINLSATTDYYLDRYEIYVKEPGQSDYSLFDSYDPSGYFRWYNFAYYFSKEGTYSIKPLIVTTDGIQYSAELSFYVNGNGNSYSNDYSNSSSSSDDTYNLDGSTYNVVPNFKTDYCFNQKDYSRFVNSSGKNRGCTATAMCIAYSIYHDTVLSPNDVQWCSAGTSWEYCNRHKEGKRYYYGYTYTKKEALKCIYNSLENDVPVIVGVSGAGCDHVVTAVGVLSNADYDNLSLSDILIVDPYGGEVTSLDKYTGIDTGWGLRVPIE